MFEAKPPSPHPAQDIGEAGELRPLTWNDLRSRLEAARDFRTSIPCIYESPASFDALAATRIAGQGEGKHCVNPDDLGHGKAHRFKSTDHNDSGSARDPRE